MAKIDILGRFVLSFEGGYVNDPKDRGGATNKGVTIATWKAQGYDKDGDGDIDVNDLKKITDADAINIMRKNYWNRWKADDIRDQSIANTLVDWVWGSGKYGITIPQQMLGVNADGVVGPKTLAALNAQNPKAFFVKLQARRETYLRNLVKNNPSQKRFLNGWLRRLKNIGYGYVILNDKAGTKITF